MESIKGQDAMDWAKDQKLQREEANRKWLERFSPDYGK